MRIENRSPLIKVALFAALAAFPVLAAAQPLGIPPGKFWKNPRIAKELGLSPAQTRKMDDIMEQNTKPLIDLKADLEKKQFDLAQGLEADKVDETRIGALVDQVEAARGNLSKSRLMMFVKMRAVLTPEQWRKLREHAEERGENRGDGLDRGEGRRDGPDMRRPRREGGPHQRPNRGPGPQDPQGPPPDEMQMPPEPPPGPAAELHFDELGEGF